MGASGEVLGRKVSVGVGLCKAPAQGKGILCGRHARPSGALGSPTPGSASLFKDHGKLLLNFGPWVLQPLPLSSSLYESGSSCLLQKPEVMGNSGPARGATHRFAPPTF